MKDVAAGVAVVSVVVALLAGFAWMAVIVWQPMRTLSFETARVVDARHSGSKKGAMPTTAFTVATGSGPTYEVRSELPLNVPLGTEICVRRLRGEITGRETAVVIDAVACERSDVRRRLMPTSG